jgi:Druantia protein DruA
MEAQLSYRHRVVSAEDVVFIRKLIAEHPQASRRVLSKLLCQAWNWVQANGALRDMVCRGLMLKLHREGLIELPPVRRVMRNPLVERNPRALIAVDGRPLQAKLGEIGPLTLRQVRRTPDEALFNSLLEQYHYLGYAQPVGEHLKYTFYAQDRPIACLSWSSAPRHLGSRDRFIGWSPQARLKNIRLLAYNSRYLILPWVKVEHLASHLLGRMAKVLSLDWQRVYGHPIYYLETFIDPQRFRGTCYRAANWQVLGVTTGRGKDAPTHQVNRSLKEVLGYPLVKDFRQQLGQVAA